MAENDNVTACCSRIYIISPETVPKAKNFEFFEVRYWNAV